MTKRVPAVTTALEQAVLTVLGEQAQGPDEPTDPGGTASPEETQPSVKPKDKVKKRASAFAFENRRAADELAWGTFEEGLTP